MAETERLKQSVGMLLQKEQQTADPEGQFAPPTDQQGQPVEKGPMGMPPPGK